MIDDMMRRITAGIAGLLLGLAVNGTPGFGSAQAAYVVDPAVGAPLAFSWTGLGPVDQINSVATSDFTINPASALRVNILLNDAFVPGAEFSLALNGSTLTPTSFGIDVNDYFFARFDDLLVPTGLQTFTISVTMLDPGSTSGTAFGGVDIVSAVPEPASLLLLGAGLAGFGLLARRPFRRPTA